MFNSSTEILPAWPHGDGEMARRIRGHDWETSSLGHLGAWPQPLKAAVDVMLWTVQPIGIGWGPNLILLYNDAWGTLIGNKHPDAFGRPAREVFPEIWSEIEPMLTGVLAGHGSTQVANQHLPLDRRGQIEDAWFSHSFDAILMEDGSAGGILNVTTETTSFVLAERECQDVDRKLRASEGRQAYLLKLSDALRPLSDPVAIQTTACRVLGEHTGASRVLYAQVVDERKLVIRGNYVNGVEPFIGTFNVDGCDGELARAYRSGEMVLYSDAATDERFTEEERHSVLKAGARANASLGLIKGGRWVARLSMHDAGPRHWTPLELVLLEETAERTWAAVERAYAEAASRDSEHRLRTLMEGMPQLVWRAEADGRWSWAGPQWTAYTGQTEAEILGWGWLEALHLADRAAAHGAWSGALANGLLELDHRIHHVTSGRYHWYQTRGVPVRDADGRILEWLCTSTDIDDQMQAREVLTRSGEALEQQVAERTEELRRTLASLQAEVRERERAEAQLRQSEKLTAIGQLTGGIAHDFNNMLQALDSSHDLMRLLLKQGEQASLTTYLDRAEDTTGRAAALVGRMLAFSRQQALEPHAVNVNRVVLGMEDLIRRSIGPAVQLELQLVDGAWLAWCDPGQLENALLNLCINSRDAMPDGGWLTIGTEEVELTVEQTACRADAAPGRYVTLSVRDTGTGIPPTVLDRVFEPFFTTKPIGQGTGLGLSQVYGFVRQSGGFVEVDTSTEPGSRRGTTVRLRFPFHAENPDHAGRPRPEPAGPTILLAEDETNIRISTADYLRQHGYRVLEAENGAAAVRLIESGASIDFLVTDQGMPGGMTGAQLITLARGRRAALPTLLMSGFADLPADTGGPVLRKPYKLSKLVRLIEETLADGGRSRPGDGRAGTPP